MYSAARPYKCGYRASTVSTCNITTIECRPNICVCLVFFCSLYTVCDYATVNANSHEVSRELDADEEQTDKDGRLR